MLAAFVVPSENGPDPNRSLSVVLRATAAEVRAQPLPQLVLVQVDVGHRKAHDFGERLVCPIRLQRLADDAEEAEVHPRALAEALHETTGKIVRGINWLKAGQDLGWQDPVHVQAHCDAVFCGHLRPLELLDEVPPPLDHLALSQDLLRKVGEGHVRDLGANLDPRCLQPL